MPVPDSRKRVPAAPASMLLAATWLAQAQAQIVGQPEEVVVVGAREVVLDAPTRTGSRLGLSARETPAIVDVLTEQRFLERGSRTSNEALNSAPGVTAVDTGGGPGTLSMRGFSGNSVSVNYDGVHQPSTMVTRNYDSFAFDRIEILKGPASVLYGEGGLGGAVNFVPKKPSADHRAFQGLAQYGTFDTYRAAVDVNVPLGDTMAVRGVLSQAGSDGYIDDTTSRTTTANLGLIHRPHEAVTSFVGIEYFRNDNTAAYWGTPLVPSAVARDPDDLIAAANGFVLDRALRRTNFQYEDASVKSDNLWLRWQLEWQIDDTWKLVNDLSYNEGDRLWDDAESYAYAVETALVTRRPVYIRNLLDFWNERVMLSSDATFGDHRNRFMVGAEHSENEHLSVRRFGSPTPTDPYHVVPGLFPEINSTNFPGAGNFADSDSLITTDAVFAENAFDLSDRLLLVGGVRYERMVLDRAIDDYNLGTSTSFERTYRQLSYRIGAVYDLSEQVHLYAQVNDAAAPVGTLVLLSASNATFDLTQGRSAEIGLKSSLWNDRVEMTVAAYRIRQTDIITRDPVNPNLSVQGGTQSSRGVELSGSAALTRRFRLDFNYAVLDARFDEFLEAGGADRAGNRPPNVARARAQPVRELPVRSSADPSHGGRAPLRRSVHRQRQHAPTGRLHRHRRFDKLHAPVRRLDVTRTQSRQRAVRRVGRDQHDLSGGTAQRRPDVSHALLIGRDARGCRGSSSVARPSRSPLAKSRRGPAMPTPRCVRVRHSIVVALSPSLRTAGA